jgi:hypothetical protein
MLENIMDDYRDLFQRNIVRFVDNHPGEVVLLYGDRAKVLQEEFFSDLSDAEKRQAHLATTRISGEAFEIPLDLTEVDFPRGPVVTEGNRDQIVSGYQKGVMRIQPD